MPSDFTFLLEVQTYLGKDQEATVVAYSATVPEALLAVDFLRTNHNIHCDLLDLRSISPMDWKKFLHRLIKPGKILVLDTGSSNNSFAEKLWPGYDELLEILLKSPPQEIAHAQYPHSY